jgi:uncharacterized membrane protein YgcG
MMTMTPRRSLLVLLLFGASALLGVPAAGAASAAGAAHLKPTPRCSLDVINDWADNGVVDKRYAIPCYTQAIQRLNQYPDVKGYSNAAEEIHAAELAAIRAERGGGSGGGTSGGGSHNGGPGGAPSSNGGGGGGPTSGSGAGGGLADRIGRDLGPSDAQSVPIPLLVLGGLAVLLLVAGAAAWIVRRVQSRRVTPAPAHAPRR